MTFNSKLTDLLKTDSNLVDEYGDLMTAAVRDKAWKLDHELIRLLLSDKEVKEKFFDEIYGHWIFNHNTFLDYITQKNFLDNSYTRFRNKIGLTIGDKYLSERGEVALVWPYKDCVLEGGQTNDEEKRKEIFFNEVLAQDEINQLLAPKVLTNFKRYTVDGIKEVTDFNRDENGVIRENLIIKGNNLLVLYSLVEQYRGQIKIVYIDPPYNTGNDSFGYNDSFNHSTWLTFMKNRLEIAKQLLSPDGVIFISCDDNEQAYLKVLLDSIFSPENGETMIWHKVGDDSGRMKITHRFRREHEYIHVCYKNKQQVFFNKFETSRDYKNVYSNPDNDPRGPYKQGIISTTEEKSKSTGKNFYTIVTPSGREISRQWRVSKAEFDDLNKDGRIYFGKNGNSIPSLKVFINESKMATPISILQDYGTAKTAGKELMELFNGERVFDYPKPPELIIHLLAIASEKNSIILDFCAGSGTTAHATIALNKEDGGNRNFILCEQMDYIETVTTPRVQKVMSKFGGGDFIKLGLLDSNQTYINLINDCSDSETLLSIWKRISDNSFLNWYVNPNMPENALNDFVAIGKKENGLVKQKRLLIEMLDKNQLYVNLSEIDDTQFMVSDVDKQLNRVFYGEDNND